MANETNTQLLIEDFAKEMFSELRVKAIDYLSRREHSRSELEEKLNTVLSRKSKRKGVIGEQEGLENMAHDERLGPFDSLLQELLDDLERLNYLSDERYVSMVLRSGFERGHGPIKVKQKLQLGKVDRQLISQAFEEFDGDWFELAREVRARKFKGNLVCGRSQEEKQEYFKEKSRQMRFLAGRGFSMDQIDYALNRSDLE